MTSKTARAALTPPGSAASGRLRAWHLLVLGAMAAAAAGAVMTRGGTTVNTVSVAVTILTAGFVAAALARTLLPLAAADIEERTDMLAGRTRAAMEREKALVLRSIKEVEFDRAMRKISDADYLEMVTRLRSRAVGLIRQLEGGGYRGVIERDLAALAGRAPVAPDAAPVPAPVRGMCPACGTQNDADARFCKSCGGKLAGAA